MKIIFLINPFSAGYDESTGDFIDRVCTEKGIEFSIEETRAEGLPEQAAEAFSNADAVICSGGDGTVHGAAEGYILSGLRDRKLGIIPAGTGNDLHRHISGRNTFRKNPGRFISGLLDGETVLHSIWAAGGKYFINYLSVGYDAVVSDAYRQKREASGTPSSRFGNYLRYIFLGLRKIGYSLEENTYLQCAEKEIRARKALVISNIRSYAGGAEVPFFSADSLSCVQINSIFGYARFMASRSIGSVRAVSINGGVLKHEKRGILQVDGENYPLENMPEELQITKVGDIHLMKAVNS